MGASARGGSRMPARLWIRCTTQRFHQSVNKRRVFSTSLRRSVLPSSAGAVLSAYRVMPFSDPAEREQEIFGPDTVAVLAAALEDAVRQLRLVDRNDPAVTVDRNDHAVTMVAKTIIELARRGECDPIRLRDQASQSFR